MRIHFFVGLLFICALLYQSLGIPLTFLDIRAKFASKISYRCDNYHNLSFTDAIRLLHRHSDILQQLELPKSNIPCKPRRRTSANDPGSIYIPASMMSRLWFGRLTRFSPSVCGPAYNIACFGFNSEKVSDAISLPRAFNVAASSVDYES